MVVHFANGFEEGIAGNPLQTPPWTVVNGSALYQNAVVKAGLLGAGLPFALGGPNNANKTVAVVNSTVNNYYMFWLRFNGVPDVTRHAEFAFLRNQSDNNCGIYVRITNVGGVLKWHVRFLSSGGGVVDVASDLVLPAINTWYRVKLFMHRDAVAGEEKVFVNGVELADISQVGQNLGLLNASWIALTSSLSAGAIGQTFYFDDVLWQDVDETVPVGSFGKSMMELLLGM